MYVCVYYTACMYVCMYVCSSMMLILTESLYLTATRTVALERNELERDLLQRLLRRLGGAVLSLSGPDSSSSLPPPPYNTSASPFFPPVASDSTATEGPNDSGNLGQKSESPSGSRCMWCQEMKVTFKRIAHGKRIICSTCYDAKIMLLG